MKTYSLFLFPILFLFGFTPNEDPKIVKLPITVTEGYASFPAGFAMLSWKNTDSTSHWYKTQADVKGIPSHWTSIVKSNIWMDAKQFAFQNFKKGNIDSKTFDDLKEGWNIDLTKRKFSDRPIKCNVYIIYGKDKDGSIKYKIDTNNNLDFSDEVEFSPAKMVFGKLDSLATHTARTIQYQAYRNGKIIDLKSRLLILENDGRLLRNFPQHAEATLDNVKLRICSQGFLSVDFDPASITTADESSATPEVVNEKEFIKINNTTYQNLGVDIDQGVLLLKKVPSDTLIYSSQVGFRARPFSGKEFTTQETVSLDMYKGKYLYLEFWGSWCGPCVKEIPNMKKAYESIDRSKIEFLGIAQDKAEPLRKLLDNQQIGWKQILCEEENGVIDDYNIQGYPTSFLIDPDGKIVAKNLRGENLIEVLNSYLKK